MDDKLKDDLAYVRALAEEGRDTPLTNGLFYVIWGVLIGGAALVTYLSAIGVFGGFSVGIWLWVGVIAAGWILCFTVGKRVGGKPGVSTLGNRTARSVWMGVGIFVTSYWLTMLLAHDNYTAYGVPPYFLFNLMFPIAFGAFGVAFFATATAGRLDWMRWFALAAWGFSAGSLFLLGSATQALVSALGCFVCAVVPGVLLMRGEPSDIV